ncbi:RidA family protein [Chromobacterium violaceum]|uniref:RidA family protein n=1 Tax=Chromobacterium violaceum TaxID=536 RepID=UPI001CE206AC|nr:RidA family protein [Chromobacterium violaceum]
MKVGFFHCWLGIYDFEVAPACGGWRSIEMGEIKLMALAALNPDTVFDSLQYGFSQAVAVPAMARRLLLSGQVGVDREENTVAPDLAGQTEQALDNIERVLAAAGGRMDQVAMLRIYIAESARHEQQVIADALRARFPRNPPASSWILVSGLSLPEWLIEIEAEAVLPG